MKIKIIISILVILFIKNIKSINILNSTIVQKSISLFGTDYNFVIGDIELSDELYLYDWISCSSVDSCPNSEIIGKAIDCSCDWTNKSQCPPKVDPYCNKICSLSITNIPSYGCDFNWTVIDELDKEYTFTINEPIQFRYKANVTDCFGISIKVNSIDGYGVTSAGGDPYPTLQRSIDSYQRDVFFNMCPTDNIYGKKSWTTDTYFIDITPTSSSYTFSIILHSIKIPIYNNSTNQPCKQLLSTHECLQLNKTYTYYSTVSLKPLNFTYQINESGYYYFNFPTINNDYIEFYISNDDNNVSPNKSNSNWEITGGNGVLMVYLLKSTNIYIVCLSTTAGYSTIFTISLNSYGKLFNLYPISSFASTQSGYINLIGTSKLIVPSGFQYSSVESLRTAFAILYPQNDSNPLWPPINTFFDNQISNLFNIYSDSFSFKSKSYQFLFLLNSTTDLKLTIYEDFKTILNSKLKFSSNIFDKNGMPINLEVSFKENKLLNCDYDKYEFINQKIYNLKNLISNSLKENEVINYSYNLGSLKLTSEFYSCQNKILEYFDIKQTQNKVLSKNCPYSSNDPLWGIDPCCNETLIYYQCCIPTLQTINVDLYNQFNRDQIKDECSSVDCTISVLTDYSRTISSIDGCTVPQYEIFQLGLDAANVIRSCKQVINAPYCSNDTDCQNYGKGICDLYQRKCLVDFEMVDKEYIRCVLNDLPIGTLFYLTNSTKIKDNSVIDLLYNQSLIQDCIGAQSIMDRSLYEFSSQMFNYQVSRCYLNKDCLDSTCLLKHDLCFEGGYIISDYSFKYDNQDISNCSLNGYCPHLQCTSDSNSNCETLCNSNSNFCGYCTNNTNNANTQCYNINNITTEQQCQDIQNNVLCLLPNGEYYTNLTDSECNQMGRCSHNCGLSCTSIVDNIDSGCFTVYIVESNCISYGGQFIDNDIGGICYYGSITNQQDCSSLPSGQNAQWIDCGSKKYGECIGPLSYNGIEYSDSKICVSKDIECRTKEECSNAGSCSDHYYFSSTENGIKSITNNLGKCITNRTSVYIVPTKACTDFQNDSPEGCYSNVWFPGWLIFNRSQCEQLGYKWWVPSTTKQECESKYGCKILEPSYSPALPYNYKWNEMSEQQCTNCENSFNQWTNKYEWTNAKWLTGISVKPQWLTRQFSSNQLKNDVFSYESFYSLVKEAVSYQNSELYRTEALCRIDRIQTSTNSLMCSCIENNNNKSTCFDSSSPIIGQTKVCSGTNSEFTFDFAKIGFSYDSIDQTCKTFTISEASKETYTSSLPQSLASNFVSYNKPDNYAVLNKNNATIGTLLSNGIVIINDEGIENINICFKVSSLDQLIEKYPILDLAIQINNESLPTPLEVQIFKNTSSISIDYYCANITKVPSGQPMYFMINRLENWENIEKELFTKDTKGLMYSLAVLFVLVALFGFIEIGVIVYRLIKFRNSIQLIQLLIIFVTIFITVRSIYFFLLVGGKLQDAPVADYILVVLPTFIYFTSFTMIIAIWYVIVFLVMKSNTSTTRLINKLYTIIITVNIVLYLFFIVIVLVFQYTKNDLNNDCGSRIPTPNVASKAQKSISLAYAIVQAFLSLIIGAAFIYLGGTLYKSLKQNNNPDNKKLKSNHLDKIYTLSIVCSIAFILHCAFVLILVTNINSMVFSFIGLIITEIAPALSILYVFNPLKKEKKLKSSEINTNEMENNQNKRKKKKNRKLNSNNMDNPINSNSNKTI